MKKILIIPLFLAAFLSFSLTAGCNNDDDTPTVEDVLLVDDNGYTSFQMQVLNTTIAQYPISALSPGETNILLYMREEEKLAHDVYLTLDNQWNARVFANISESEATHMAAVKVLLDRYNLSDPAAGNDVGVFTNTTLQALYDSLVVVGQQSLIDALKVGAAIEELDVSDIADAMTYIDNSDIIYVFDNLMKGSRNHLRAFVKNLNVQGVTYIPQYLDQTSYDAIITSATEHGPNH
jgi:hypothetical protein